MDEQMDGWVSGWMDGLRGEWEGWKVIVIIPIIAIA